MIKSKSNRLSAADLSNIAMFTAVMAVCAWISIPSSVPFTLQTFGVFLTVGVLGGKKGTLAVLNYLFIGIVGAPVFSGFSGGIGMLLGNTGGYIIGFLFSAMTMWTLESLLGKKRWVLLFSMIVALFICYAFGTIWFLHVYTGSHTGIELGTVLLWCVIPYLIPDMIKISLAFFLCKRLEKLTHQKYGN